MPDYQQGKIYRVTNDINDIVYVGSTTLKISERMNGHRTQAKSKPSDFYSAMRDIGVEHFKIKLIKYFPCDSLLELEAEEFRIMQKYEKKRIELYNMVILRSESKPAFKRGCVTKSGNYWMFKWRENGKDMTKSFPVKRLGEREARKMAEAMRDEIYPLE